MIGKGQRLINRAHGAPGLVRFLVVHAGHYCYPRRVPEMFHLPEMRCGMVCWPYIAKAGQSRFSLMESNTKMTERKWVIASLILLGILIGYVTGCAPATTPLPVPPTPTLPPGWVTRSASADQGQCGYTIDHPSDMDFTSQGAHSWILSHTATEPGGAIPNFIYISVIPDDSQSDEAGLIYNYDPDETQALLSMQVGESKSLRSDPILESWFTYTRLPDSLLGNQAAKMYENTQPWEFPLGTKEIRHYLQVNNCIYLIGGYIATVGSGQPGAIDEELFDEILASFRLAL